MWYDFNTLAVEADNQWLLTNVEPIDEVFQKWKSVYSLRKKLIFDDQIPILEYFDKYPCIETYPVKLVRFFL